MKRFEEFNILGQTKDALYRLARINFGKDGSLYVSFPGLPQTEGIAAKLYFPGGSTTRTLELKQHGKVTSQGYFVFGFNVSLL